MKAFFDGEWQETGAAMPVVNPYSGEAFDELSLCDHADLDRAVAALQKDVRILKKVEQDVLHRVFVRLLELLRENAEELSLLITAEQGKRIEEARWEVKSGLDSLESLSLNPSLVGQSILPLANEASMGERYGFTLRHPHGVVAIISPNPQPFILPLVNTVYALSAGNAVILKPSRHTSLIVGRLVEFLLEAGLPPEAIAFVPGTGKGVGSALVSHPGIDHLLAAGSLRTIRKVRNRMGFVTSQLQWGCVATCIVGKTANLDHVRDEILRVAFECSGQAAFTPSWVACFEQNHDDLRDILKAAMDSMNVGDPRLVRTQIGPLTETRKVERLENRIEAEVAMGAEIVTGGRVEKQLYRPMLLDGCVLEKTAFAQREIAAPIIGLTSIRKAAEATRLLSEQRHHVLTLFSDDIDWAARRATRMPFNNVHINGIPTWRDGLICLPGHPVRTGRRTPEDRISDMSHVRDVILHPNGR
jgi:acyl-CoA reductase-like NAD-dependent aldehyde dehydrogenase